jgi:hypothetical protein
MSSLNGSTNTEVLRTYSLSVSLSIVLYSAYQFPYQLCSIWLISFLINYSFRANHYSYNRTLLSSGFHDEYDRYCAEPTLPDTVDAIQWWLEPSQQRNFPNLSKMALDLLSIPAMSTEAERIFSYLEDSISERRNKSNMDLVEALVLLKSWMKLKDN